MDDGVTCTSMAHFETLFEALEDPHIERAKQHALLDIMTILRHIALNLFRQDMIARRGIKARRLKAGWDLPYLLTVLAG